MRTIRVIIILILAAAIVWLFPLGGRRSSRETQLGREDVAAGLARRLPEIHLHHSSFKQAIALLQKASGANIVVGYEPSKRDNPSIDIDLAPGTLEEALDRLIDQRVDSLGYDAAKRKITITWEHSLPHVLRIYDLDDLAEFRRESDTAASAKDRLADQIIWYVDLGNWYWYPQPVSGPVSPSVAPLTCSEFRFGKWFVTQTRQRHRRIARLLAALRAATPEGVGSEDLGFAIPSPVGDFPDRGVLRVYDVRDLADAYASEEYAEVTQMQPDERQSVPTRKSLLASIFGARHETVNTANEIAGTRCVIAGRLILDAPPEVHRKVVKLLRELRAER